MALHHRFTAIVGLAVVLAIVLTGAVPAGASGGTIQLRGVMTPYDGEGGGRCYDHPEAVAIYWTTGSLVGCWWIDTLVPTHFTPSGSAAAYGTESFDGWLDGDTAKYGTFTTTFKTTAKFAPDGTEQHGRCYHEIKDGAGYFAGASGSLTMHDEPDGCVNYTGHVAF